MHLILQTLRPLAFEFALSAAVPTFASPPIYNGDWFAGFSLARHDTVDTVFVDGAIVDANDRLLSGFRNDSFAVLRLTRHL